jgi:DNA-binding LacI/PurR family transcriptional regulator
MKRKLPTIKEIAERLNISISSVSKALRDHPSIGLLTRMRVKKLAEELGYERNQTAINFLQQKSFIIGVIVPELKEEFFSAAMNGIEKIARNNNYVVLIGQSHDDEVLERNIVESMKKHRVDGVLVSISKKTRSIEHFNQLEKSGIVVVYFDRIPDTPDIHSVSCNLYYSSMETIEFLIDKGHKRIGYIQGPETLSIKNERLNGYYDAHKKRKMPVDDALIVSTDFSSGSTFQAMEKLLKLRKRPTAIIAFNDYVAFDAIEYAKNQKIKINKDIAFVSYANVPISHYMDHPPLASIEQFPYEQGCRAAELLISLIDNTSENPPYQNIELRGGQLIMHA